MCFTILGINFGHPSPEGRETPLRGGLGPRFYLQLIWGFPKIRGTLFGGPHNKDYSILGSIWGFPYLGKLPFYVSGDLSEEL